MCQTYDKSKGGDTRELQSRMVPPQKKLGRVTLKSKTKARLNFSETPVCMSGTFPVTSSHNLNKTPTCVFFVKTKQKSRNHFLKPLNHDLSVVCPLFAPHIYDIIISTNYPYMAWSTCIKFHRPASGVTWHFSSSYVGTRQRIPRTWHQMNCDCTDRSIFQCPDEWCIGS